MTKLQIYPVDKAALNTLQCSQKRRYKRPTELLMKSWYLIAQTCHKRQLLSVDNWYDGSGARIVQTARLGFIVPGLNSPRGLSPRIVLALSLCCSSCGNTVRGSFLLVLFVVVFATWFEPTRHNLLLELWLYCSSNEKAGRGPFLLILFVRFQHVVWTHASY